jgi:hypothetical protein
MEFERIRYKSATGKYSKLTETYNFHKAAAVLAEYGFDCVRVVNDWRGADFLAYQANRGITLPVQLKTCLVIDKRYFDYPELYICFPLDGTGNWYLLKHRRLYEIIKVVEPKWLESNKWTKSGGLFRYTATQPVRNALVNYAYQSNWGDLGFRECVDQTKAGHPHSGHTHGK